MGRKPKNEIVLDKAVAEYRAGVFTSMRKAAIYYGVSRKMITIRLGDFRHRKRRSLDELVDYIPRKRRVKTPALKLSYSLPKRLPHQSDRVFGDLYILQTRSSMLES